jgi:hypothetical protein
MLARARSGGARGAVGELMRLHAPILAILALWAFAPLMVEVIYVLRNGGALTGVNGTDYFDQFQYLAWIHDAGNHLLASNLWVIGHTPHDYLHPMYVISALLWRLGLSIQLAYLMWKPVAVFVLFLGVAAYVRHLLPSSRWQQMAAVFLALFYATPVLAVSVWIGHLSALHRFQLLLAVDDGHAALQLWGFEHTAIAIGLMPVFLIGADRLLNARNPIRSARGWVAITALAGLLVSWLHPWQGATLLLIVGGMFVLRGPRPRYLALAVPAVATLTPLLYGLALSHFDSAWHAFQVQSETTGTAPWWALLASFGPLAAFAGFGIRRPQRDRELMLLLWLVACPAVYFLVPEFPPHALAGITVPLAMLAVRGWERARAFAGVGLRAAAPIAVAAVAAFAIPAAVYHAQSVNDDVATATAAGGLALQQLRLTSYQAAALAYLDRVPRRGGVLAPWLLSMSVPGLTGREAFAGHLQWQPHSHVPMAEAFFNPLLNDPRGSFRRSILEQSKATFVVADCGTPAALGAAIAPIAHVAKRFGCVTVYERG